MSTCDVCENFAMLQKATCDEKAFRWSVIKTLCYIVEYLSEDDEEVLPTTNVLPQVTLTAAEVEADYATFASTDLLSSTKQLNQVRIVNSTDADLLFSYDGGGSVAFIVQANTTYTETLNMTFTAITSFQMKKINTAGNGSVYIEGRYNS